MSDLLSELERTMREYLPNAEYTDVHVDRCLTLLRQYATNMNTAADRKEGMEYVEHTVLQLNALDNGTDNTLIETGERELIAEFIITQGHRRGFNSLDEDITEEYREW
ncbi:hypothetical protein [Neolewinella sp.]|uniref:hypothetical protein n=1 Tax=Neolewinella sp. TaxID=2993543 RepID=UPI003B52F85E